MKEIKVLCNCGEEIGSIVVTSTRKLVGTGGVDAISKKPGELQGIRINDWCDWCEECTVPLKDFETSEEELKSAEDEVKELTDQKTELEEKLAAAERKIIHLQHKLHAAEMKAEEVVSSNTITIGE